MREQTIAKIKEEKIIIIVRGVDREKLIPMAEAMYEGGIRLLELTYDAKGNPSDEEIADRIAMLAKHFEGRMLIGAGTVLTEKQVALTKAAGGRFIISPDAAPEVIKATRAAGLVSIPGCLTPSEMHQAHKDGADFIKLFPADAFGPSYFKAVKAPLSHLDILAVGGVSTENLADYQAAGAAGYGMASNILDRKAIAENDWQVITGKARKYVELVK
ncbi:MAG: bifunctional 4-hydroxy-2-oxoglutarate aldolase/2-dehydro-3-deoxy-phosphogluconate aldolase [Clostridia bacterium]|nr:bifunctional 4-hydroxy-2-oxoglutarate aldolase/2-dehydro-3-deoxy-phosphogluconate aldolase [Clostridia bacterium]